MNILASLNLPYVVSGFSVGLLVGMTGVGGGSFMTPLLVLFFGIHPSTAVGTDLLYAAATKSCGTLVHGVVRTINWRIVGLLAAGSVPMTITTIFVLSRLDIHSQATHRLTTLVLGYSLFLTAIALVFRNKLLMRYEDRIGRMDPRLIAWLTIAVGAMLGTLVTISSVGAGAIGVTALILLYPKLPIVHIVGSDIAHAVPLTFIAGLGHWMLGSFDGNLLSFLLVGSVPGIICGSYLASRVPEFVLRWMLATTLLVVGAKLLF